LFAQHARRGSGAELVQDRECLPLLGFGSVPCEHARMLIRTAQRFPGARSAAPVAGDFRRVRFRDIRRLLSEGTYPPQPARKLAFHAWIALRSRKLIRRLHLTEDALPIACEPRGLGTNRSERADALQLPYRASERACLF